MQKRPYSGVLLVSCIISLMIGMLLHKLSIPESATAQPIPRDIVTTKGLQLVNDQGEIRASLVLWDGEHPALILSDKHCPRRASLSVYSNNRAALNLFGENCKRRVVLELENDGLPELVLRDQFNTPRSRIHLLKNGNPRVVLYDENGKDYWMTPEFPELKSP